MEKNLAIKTPKNAANILKNKGILAFPTETVFGLGVIFDDKNCFDKLVKIKRRPPEKPFGLMCSSLEQALEYIDVGEKTIRLMDKFLPGEITFLVKAKEGLPPHVTLGTGVIGIRVPASAFLIEMIECIGKPILQTSANRSGEPTLTRYEDVVEEFKDDADGIVEGECEAKKASTIVNLTNEGKIILVREGPIPFSDIESYWRELE